MVMVKCHIWMVKVAFSPWKKLRTSQDSTAGEKLDVLLGSICSCDVLGLSDPNLLTLCDRNEFSEISFKLFSKIRHV